MKCQINGVAMHFVEHGAGLPLVALHGAGVDHREIEAAVEAIVPDTGYRRIYPDLPGMGCSTSDGLTCNDDVVTLLGEFIDHLAGEPVLLIGHSYGAYLARGVAAQRPDAVLGLALVCPVAERTGNVPEQYVVRQDAAAYDELEPAQRPGFDEYFVVRTPATARRYRDHVVPGTALVDEAALERMFAGWTVDVGSATFSAPTLIAAGRRDSVVGYSDAAALLERYPRATLAVIEEAGHALMHERPELFAAFFADWLDRARAEPASVRRERRSGPDESEASRALHTDEIPIDSQLVRVLVDRNMPQYTKLPVRQLASSGSTNALFRLGEDLLVRLPRQPGGSTTISKEAEWLPLVGPALPVAVPEVVATFEAENEYPERWSVVRWIDGEHPAVVGPETPIDPRRADLAVDLAEVLKALAQTEVPSGAINDPDLQWYRGEPLATMDGVTRQNIEQCRALGDFEFDLDAAERLWDEAIRLPGAQDRPEPRWYHGDLAAENLLVRDARLAAILDFGGLSIGDPTVDLAVAWEVLDPPARETFRSRLGVDDATWLRGRAWALCITLMIWYYWTTMAARRASRVAIGRNVLADAGYVV